MKNKKAINVILSTLLVTLLLGCKGNEKTDIGTTDIETTEEIKGEIQEDLKEPKEDSYKKIYLNVLNKYSDRIVTYNQYRQELDSEEWDEVYAAPIAIEDITGDYVPELIFIAQNTEDDYSAGLYIYTVENDEARQIYYDGSWDLQVAGGTAYSLFQIDGESTLYGCNGECDEFTDERYYRYDVCEDGSLIATELMTRYKSPNYDYTDIISLCTIAGEETSEENFQNNLDTLTCKMDRLLIYNYKAFDENANDAMYSAKKLFLTYDEAVSLLSK